MNKRIVIVDDDESIRKTFFLILNRKYRVYLAKDAREALDRFKNANVDLIIADYMLPDLNGVELVSRFRKIGYAGDVILISAHPDRVRREDLARLNIGDLFVKPLDLESLNLSIDRLLDSKQDLEKRV
jgi:DNA-binding NtrC family response regulator